jgi:hypothetical protein
MPMKITVDKEKLPDPDKLSVLAKFLEQLFPDDKDVKIIRSELIGWINYLRKI